MRTKTKKKKAQGAPILQRHYCNKCGRKRYEYDMHVIGSAAWGKKKWKCNEECSHLKGTTAYQQDRR